MIIIKNNRLKLKMMHCIRRILYFWIVIAKMMIKLIKVKVNY